MLFQQWCLLNVPFLFEIYKWSDPSSCKNYINLTGGHILSGNIIMTLRKFCLTLWIISSAEIFAFYKQTIWPIVVEMNDVYTLSLVSFQREHIGCIECAVTASSMMRWSFSCSNDNQTCLIHDDCLEKSTLLPQTLTDSKGWRHFCRPIRKHYNKIIFKWFFYNILIIWKEI